MPFATQKSLIETIHAIQEKQRRARLLRAARKIAAYNAIERRVIPAIIKEV